MTQSKEPIETRYKQLLETFAELISVYDTPGPVRDQAVKKARWILAYEDGISKDSLADAPVEPVKEESKLLVIVRRFIHSLDNPSSDQIKPALEYRSWVFVDMLRDFLKKQGNLFPPTPSGDTAVYSKEDMIGFAEWIEERNKGRRKFDGKWLLTSGLYGTTEQLLNEFINSKKEVK